MVVLFTDDGQLPCCVSVGLLSQLSLHDITGYTPPFKGSGDD